MSSASLQEAARRLVSKAPGWEPVRPAPVKGARSGETATGRPSSAPSADATSFEESDASLREYFPAVTYTSSDGLFTFEVEPIRQISLVGDGTFIFDEPPAP